MEHLHAYWRMEYIKSPERHKIDGNPFIHLPEQTDEEAYIVYRSSHNYLVLNRFPYNAGHLMVVPYREVGELEDMQEEEFDDHMRIVVKSKKVLTAAIQPHGFNIGYNFGCAAGAGIPQHLHCHVVPRWSGDTNMMPVIGDTRVLPESLRSMWERLRSFV